MLNISYRGTTYCCRTEADIEIACADIAEREAQREAIARRQLVWSPKDEPIPGPRARRVEIR